MALDGFIQWVIHNKYVLAFYLIAVILIYIYRKRFDVESGFILLYRTDFGIKFMDRLANKNKEFWKLVGYSAIGLGFLGMIAMAGLLLHGLYNLIFVPSAPATVALVIPGVQVPGSQFVIPFAYGIAALFIVILVHEFGHGVIAKAHGLKIKNTGFGFMGPIPLAFVEPDEKQVVKKDSVTQHSIFAAGPFFNGILFIFAVILIFGVFAPLFNAMSTDGGVVFDKVQKNYPASIAGLEADTRYTTVNGAPVHNLSEFITITSTLKPNDTLTISNSKESHTITAGVHPTDSSRGYIGVIGADTYHAPKNGSWWYAALHSILDVLKELMQWVATLSLGIGLANLLPLGPVDGGRMFHKAAVDIKGKAKGVKIWATVTIITLCVMAILVFTPIIRSVFKI